MACSDGLQTIGVFGNSDPGLGCEKWPIMSKIPELLLLVAAGAEFFGVRTKSASSSSSDVVFL